MCNQNIDAGYIPNKAKKEEFTEKGERKWQSFTSANNRKEIVSIRGGKKSQLEKKKKGREVPVDEERGREENQRGKSIGIDNEDEVAHSSCHGCFA